MVVDCTSCPLRKNDLFRPIGEDALAFMRRFKVGELKVDRGTPLLMEGSNAPQLYTALRGMGVRYKLLPDGARQVISFVLPGDFIGLQAGVMGEMKHSVEAVTSMTLCVFDRSELWTMFKQQPALAFDMTWLAANEEHFLGEALTSVGQMPAIQRLSWGLKRFFMRCENLGLTKEDTCPFPFRQQDLADALGLSLVHTNKTLMKLRQRQLLSLQDGELRLLDRARLDDVSMLEVDLPGQRPLI